MIIIAIVLFVISIAMLFWGFSTGNEFTYDERNEDRRFKDPVTVTEVKDKQTETEKSK